MRNYNSIFDNFGTDLRCVVVIGAFLLTPCLVVMVVLSVARALTISVLAAFIISAASLLVALAGSGRHKSAFLSDKLNKLKR